MSLLTDLQERGVTLEVAGDTLRYKAPPGALTNELREAMWEYKTELIRELHAAHLIASIWGDADYIMVDINEYGDWLEQYGLEHTGWDVPKDWPHGDAWPMLRVKVQRNVQGTKETQ